ncbi:MAG TPA: HAD family hydrolase [Thermoanaerobaculia bacterium]|nr:HAD family hydrolase [Thermoanaerobaculia bacterium]
MVPAPRALRAVLLDMGGVLLDFGNAEGLPVGRHDWRGREALLALLRRPGGPPLAQKHLDELLFEPWKREHARRYERVREADWHPHLARLRRHAKRRFSDRRLLATWFAPFAETVTPVPGAQEAVAALAAAGVPLALVSNIPLPSPLYRDLLARHGFLPAFAHLQWSYDAGSRKPSPAMLHAALAALGVPPEEALMVGDRRSADVVAGRAAGVATAWLRSADTAGPVPDFELATIGELPALVARLRAEAKGLA